MPDYDSMHFSPSAPVATATLRNPENGTMISDILLLMDTGADITLLPRDIVEHLGIKLLPDQQYELVGFDGNRSLASAVLADVIFLNRAFRGRYLLIDHERGIMGRDILNHIRLLLNGSQQQWSEHKLQVL